MKIRVYTDYDPIKILHGVKDEPNDALAAKCGLKGNFVVMDSSELPQSRENRAEWKHKDGRIVVDQAKVSARVAKESEKVSKKQAVLAKLKLSEEEVKTLLS